MRAFLICVLAILATVGASASMSEQERIGSHLKLVEKLLRAQGVAGLEPALAKRRAQGLDHLHEYWQRGEFPHNTGHRGVRHPYFIDHRGVPCAAGYLVIRSGRPDLAERIARESNELYLDQMDDPEIQEWVRQSGFSLGELRLIQPAYSYQATYEDPLLEKAYLEDLAGVSSVLAGETVSQERLDDALRVAVLNYRPRVEPLPWLERLMARAGEMLANWFDGGKRQLLYKEPAPLRGQGLEVISLLLAKGANPGDRSLERPSTVFHAEDPKLKALLAAKGASLTPQEDLLEAIAKADAARVQALLEAPGFEPYSGKYRLPTPLRFAFHSLGKAHGRGKNADAYFVPLDEVAEPPLAVIRALLKSPRIRVEETLPPPPPGFERDRTVGMHPALTGNLTLLGLAIQLTYWNVAEELIRRGAVPRSAAEFEDVALTWLNSFELNRPPARFTAEKARFFEDYLVKHRGVLDEAGIRAFALKAQAFGTPGAMALVSRLEQPAAK